MASATPPHTTHQRLESFGPGGWVMTDPTDAPQPTVTHELTPDVHYLELADSRMVVRGLGHSASTPPEELHSNEPDRTEALAVEDEVEIHADSAQRLREIISEAASFGVDEQDLVILSQIFRNDNAPDQLDTSRFFIQKSHLDISPQDLRKLVLHYKKELMRAEEKGVLYHYHQTKLAAIDGILDDGELISGDELRQRRLPVRSIKGYRGKVQMTRDMYDKDGELVATGIKNTSAGLGAADDITLVFNETIIDETEYNCVDKYPDMPSAPLSKLKCLLVKDEQIIPMIKKNILERGLSIDVISRREWLDAYKTQGTRTSY